MRQIPGGVRQGFDGVSKTPHLAKKIFSGASTLLLLGGLSGLRYFYKVALRAW
jgi:hypothetical protein